MAIVVRCPQCRKWNAVKTKTCKCGAKLEREKFYGVVYYDPNNRQHWKSIGHSKRAAEQFDYEAKIAKNEGRYIKQAPGARTTFKTLAHWYLELPEVKVKRSYDRDKQSLDRLLPYFGDKLLKEITPAKVEAYRQARLAEPSGRTPQTLTKPATVNRELACFKTIFNKAIANGKAEHNPAAKVKLLKENNERDRILSSEEYIRLLAACPPHLKPIVKVAYQTAMRQGEIVSLTWDQVDLKEGFITLRPEDTKTNDARLIPLSAELMEMFKAMPRGLPNMPVFTYHYNDIYIDNKIN